MLQSPFSNDHNNPEEFPGHHDTSPDFTAHVIMFQKTSGDVIVCIIVTGSKARAFEVNPTRLFSVVALAMKFLMLAGGITEKGAEKGLQDHKLLREMIQEIAKPSRSRDRPLVLS